MTIPADRPAGRLVPTLQVAAKALLTVGVIGVLVWQLARIGWRPVLAALPTSPSFYLLGALLYLVLPASEVLIFRRLWGIGWSSLPVMLRKRVYNEAILDYAGEAMLARWASRHLGLTPRASLSSVKDSALLSGLASNTATVGLLALLMVGTDLPFLSNGSRLLWLAAGLAMLLTLAVLLLRRHLLGVPAELALFIFGVHAARVLVVIVLQAAQWWVAMPATPLSLWFTFLTLRMVVTRIPFLPNRDIAFAGAGMAMGGLLGLPAAGTASANPEAAIAALFAAGGALTLAIHALTYLMTQRTAPAAAEPAREG